MAKFDPSTIFCDCIVFSSLDAMEYVTSLRSNYHTIIATNRNIKLLDFPSNIKGTMKTLRSRQIMGNDIPTNFYQHELMAYCPTLF